MKTETKPLPKMDKSWIGAKSSFKLMRQERSIQVLECASDGANAEEKAEGTHAWSKIEKVHSFEYCTPSRNNLVFFLHDSSKIL